MSEPAKVELYALWGRYPERPGVWGLVCPDLPAVEVPEASAVYAVRHPEVEVVALPAGVPPVGREEGEGR